MFRLAEKYDNPALRRHTANMVAYSAESVAKTLREVHENIPWLDSLSGKGAEADELVVLFR